MIFTEHFLKIALFYIFSIVIHPLNQREKKTEKPYSTISTFPSSFSYIIRDNINISRSSFSHLTNSWIKKGKNRENNHLFCVTYRYKMWAFDSFCWICERWLCVVFEYISCVTERKKNRKFCFVFPANDECVSILNGYIHILLPNVTRGMCW